MPRFYDMLNTAGAARFHRTRRIAATALLLMGLAPVAASADPVPAGGTGGPFESILSADAVTPAAADAKFHALFASWSQADRGPKHAAGIAVPSQQPLSGFILTSGFGVRVDPFRGTAAMHPGIDMAAPTGTPVYATADGVVARAEWSGGYGNMVEIDHGRGIHTRYGHLSAILTAVNNRVHRGDLIGRVGSTGRSTGSHLHYEVRLDDRPINPMPFVQGAGYVTALRGQAGPQFNAAPTQVALRGQPTQVASVASGASVPVASAMSGSDD